MRYALLFFCLLFLAGCGNKTATSPRPTAAPKPTSRPPNGVAADIPTPPPSALKTATAKVRLDKGNHRKFKPLPTPNLPAVSLPTPTPIPAKDYTAVLSGSVVNAKDNSPIAGAVVTIGRPGQLHTTKTDGFGKFRIKFPGGPMVPVQATMTGFAGALAIGRITPHHTTRITLKLSPVVPNQPPQPAPPAVFGATP